MASIEKAALRQIPAAVENLKSNVEMATKFLDAIEVQLGDVLSPSDMENEVAKPCPPVVGLAQTVNLASYQVNLIANRLNDLSRRLEL